MILSTRRAFGKIFIRSISKEATIEEIKELVKVHGEVTSFDIPIKDDNSIRGFAYVTYKEDADAQNASQKLNQSLFKGTYLIANFIKSDTSENEIVLNTRAPFTPRPNYDDDPLIRLNHFHQ